VRTPGRSGVCTQLTPFPWTLADRGSGRAASVCGGDGTYDRCGVDRSRRNYWVRARVRLWNRGPSLCAGRLYAASVLAADMGLWTRVPSLFIYFGLALVAAVLWSMSPAGCG